MKTIYTLALIAAGTVLITGMSLRASEADGRIELAVLKSADYQPHLRYAEIKIGAEANEPAGFRLQDDPGNGLAPQVRSEAGAQAGTIYSPKIELRAARPNNFVLSDKHPSLEFSGIMVQSVRNNPLQLFNPLAPPQYGDGKANTVFNIITGRAEGLKMLAIGF